MGARRQARPGLSSFLFCEKPMDLAFLHFFPPIAIAWRAAGPAAEGR